ncbi:hypothetical protein Ae201684_008017 [Aphanomyces euteiches]|uniref:Uncharacterized protein n=1 Tax=Aphanomyces euteiches TaxID=100861 RepID=A0A6G0X6T2_9STRA|nr:hypothetical protein Ae201684_008017 [Aphanomyces euteiches]
MRTIGKDSVTDPMGDRRAMTDPVVTEDHDLDPAVHQDRGEDEDLDLEAHQDSGVADDPDHEAHQDIDRADDRDLAVQECSNVASAPIRAPVRAVHSFDREEIVAFVKKREQYETELRAEAQMQGFSYKGHARRWVDSVDRDMLETACDIIWGCKVEELSEETFKAHVMKIIETRPTTWEATESDMKRALRDVKLKLDGAIHGKALSFLNDVRRVIKTECLSESLKDIETRKLFMKAVISRITPVDLSQRVHDVFILKKRDYTLPELFEVMKEQMNRTLDAEAILMHREGCRKRERTDEKPSDTHKRHRSEHRSKYGPPHGRSATPPAAQRSKQEELRANTRQNQGASHYGPSNNKPQVTFEDHGAKGLC